MSDSARRLLIVFVDAMGPAQLQRFHEQLAFLPHRRTLRGILGYSSGALPTILTGAPPSVHGRMCLFSRNVDESESILSPLSMLGLLPRAIHERNAVRRIAASLLAKHCGLSGYVALHRVPPEAFRWIDMPEREDLFQAEMIGRARTFLADARQAGLCVFTANWRMPEAERWQNAFSTIEAMQPDLTFLYATELDGHLHEHGNANPSTDEVISRIAQRIGRAREILAKDARPFITIVVGDHGMADVTRTVDPRPCMARLRIEHSIVDSTMWRFWGNDAMLSGVRRELEFSNTPGSWLDLRSLRARSVPTAGAPFGQALWLLPEGMIFAPSWVGNKARGMHGYDIGTQSSLAALAADDAAISSCTSLTDVAPLIRKYMGLDLPRSVNA